MKYFALTTAAILFGLGLAPQPAAAADKIIFGEDDRVEFYQVPQKFRAAAEATVSLWSLASLKPVPAEGKVLLSTRTLGEAYKLCPGERFSEQPAGAGCSGSLVGEDLVLTAGHCVVSEKQCADTAFVFGYALRSAQSPSPASVPASDVYSCAQIIKRDWTNYTVSENGGQGQTIYGDDFALIRLDRKVAGRKPLALNRAGGLKKGDGVVAMGHPNGLPFKLAGFGTVVTPVVDKMTYFLTNLDVFGGNSGGPALNAVTGLIEGVVVRADADHFLRTFEGCYVHHVKPQNAGAGISVNKLGPVLDLVPPTPDESAAAARARKALERVRKDPLPALNENSLRF